MSYGLKHEWLFFGKMLGYSETRGGEPMEDKRQSKVITMKTERANITIYRPQAIEEERERILKRIAEIKAMW